MHISKVRSCALDKWTHELVDSMEAVGNERANLFWEFSVPADVERPREGDMKLLDRWIRDKYERGLYKNRSAAAPDGKAAGAQQNTSHAHAVHAHAAHVHAAAKAHTPSSSHAPPALPKKPLPPVPCHVPQSVAMFDLLDLSASPAAAAAQPWDAFGVVQNAVPAAPAAASLHPTWDALSAGASAPLRPAWDVFSASLQPAAQPAAQPVTQPDSQPAVQPAVQPVVQPAVQPAAPLTWAASFAAPPPPQPSTSMLPADLFSAQGYEGYHGGYQSGLI